MEMQSNFEPQNSNMLDDGFDGYSNISAKRAARKAKRAEKKSARKAKKSGAAPVASTEVVDTAASKEASAPTTPPPTDSTKTETKDAGAAPPPDADTKSGGDSNTPSTDDKFLGMPKTVGYAVVGLGVIALCVGAYFLLRSKPVPVS